GSRARSQHGIDLLDAPFQVVGPRDEAARLARQLGVAETALEAHGADGPAVLNAVPLFAAAARQGVPVLTIAPGKPRALDGLALPAPFKAVLREDLARGRTVILPSRLVTLAGARTFGWWSVEPTGYAIGRMELGGAQGLVESSRMNELITEWTRIYVEFLGGVLRCYMDALADALGGVEIKNMKVKVTVKHGDPGDSPMPEVNELVACVIDKACDAVKELASSYFAGASHFDEGGRLWEMIAHTLEKKATGWATGKAGEGCKAAASAAASAASR
ncbi:MAG TPA: hypothetical protein VIW03_00595, partial [Anaeromyxobacter sp.]